MKMNMPLVAAGVAMAAGLAGEARALTIAGSGNPQVVLRVAGSSAMSKAFAAVVDVQLCQPGTNTVYWDDRTPLAAKGAEDGARYQAYYCTAKAGITGIAAGVRLLVVKRDLDGSLQGIGPVINKQNIEFMKLDTTCTDLGAGVIYPNPRFLCSGVENAVPDGGLSDVERSLFATLGRFTQTVPGAVTEVRNQFGQGFGIAVSDTLYSALQAAQGLTVGATDAVNQPKITRSQYTSIVSQSSSYTDARFLTGVTGKLFNCRRQDSSATQVASDIFFLDNPCQLNAYPSFGTLNPKAAGSYGNLTVIENPSTADAVNCLRDADTTTAGQEQAIGVVSLENVPSTGWKFVKLDGVSPNFYAIDPDGAAGPLKRGDPDATQRRNVLLGHYLFAFEGTVLWRNDSPLAGSAGAMRLIADGLGSPTLAAFNGVYQVRRATATPTPITNANFPAQVAKGTRFANSCQNMQLYE